MKKKWRQQSKKMSNLKKSSYIKYPENVRQYKYKIEIEKGEKEIEIKEGEKNEFKGSENCLQQNQRRKFPQTKEVDA